MDRKTAYDALVAERKACRSCVGLTNPAAIAGGRYDSLEIGPWTLWQGCLDAKLMVIGQDWGDVDCLEADEGRDSPNNPTNAQLRHLFSVAGIDITPAGTRDTKSSHFFTNAVLCLKEEGKGLSAPVFAAWFRECGPRFLRPQIEIIRPRIVVTLGAWAYYSVAYAFGFRAERLRDAVELDPPRTLLSNVALMPVYHCSPRVLASWRKRDQQEADWHRIGKALGTTIGG